MEEKREVGDGDGHGDGDGEEAQTATGGRRRLLSTKQWHWSRRRQLSDLLLL